MRLRHAITPLAASICQDARASCLALNRSGVLEVEGRWTHRSSCEWTAGIDRSSLTLTTLLDALRDRLGDLAEEGLRPRSVRRVHRARRSAGRHLLGVCGCLRRHRDHYRRGARRGKNFTRSSRHFSRWMRCSAGIARPGKCAQRSACWARRNEEHRFVSGDVIGPIELNDEEIRERMSGNLCRCGAYVNIVAAIRRVASAESAP